MSNPFFGLPVTKPGRWSVWLAVVFAVMFMINSFVFMPTSSNAPWRQLILPFYGIAMLLCGLAAGIVGLIALILYHDRSWLVWITIWPGVLVLFLVLGEFLVPH